MARDLYGSFGSVPDGSTVNFTPQPYQDIRANANMFGAQVGEAHERRGAQYVKEGTEMMEREIKRVEQETEARVNDDYANVYVPKAAELRAQYDMLEGREKVDYHPKYMEQLQKLNDEFTGGAKGVYEGQLKRDMTSRRFAQDSESAARELAVARKDMSIKAAVDKMMSDDVFAASNYNNPQYVQEAMDSKDGTIELLAIDNGIDPNTPEGSAAIEQAKNAARGEMAVGMINSALQRGDAAAANKIRSDFGPFLPGYEQERIDSVLTTENLRQTSVNGVDAVVNGAVIPQPVGFPEMEVQAVVADTAEDHGVDANMALTFAMIETSMGKNLGKRGDIGQTGKPAKDLHEQSFNMITEMKKSQNVARQALGREPEPWEVYLCYQQGAGGGPALLKAAMNAPNAKATEILAPLYKTPDIAQTAITHNGGNSTMTSGDFLELIKNKYDRNALNALCTPPKDRSAPVQTPEGTAVVTEPTPQRLGDAIRSAYSQTGETVQPAATPMQDLANFQQKLPGMLARINNIPQDSVKKAMTQELAAREGIINARAEAYKAQVYKEAETLQYDEGFTAVTQVPSALRSKLQSEFPEKWIELRLAADKNRGFREDPLVTADLYARLDTMFDVRTKDGRTHVTARKGKLDDAARLQDEILDQSERGLIPAETAKSMVKTLQINMGAMAASGKSERKMTESFSKDHYTKAFHQFANSGASQSEVNRMFRDYVAASDEFKFDEQKQDSWYDGFFASKDTKKDAPQVTPKLTVKAILEQQVQGKYQGLVLREGTPNAAIGRNGSSTVVTDEEPTMPSDNSVDPKIRTVEYNGKTYIEHEDGSWEEVGG